ncbi:Uma2 family endonuclease [Aureimonas jatrophae]|uniref:Endonuclease, Uma2 family (Restriction endonuclease fold) n=1 Tax=Aureimonas jatrophae TaxID=1166073 RepID=A0A1H0K3X2_9HYPH|nr:Uma2 family endonuclease [Aureimonas jatrophae]MBB3950939.1 Uma2 family endonuclease [Aureimonas jatrophae]SDO50725.1 Endonuclease, Uma2 family (restriction endonuclease fold) [Aureimonas jatrophae]
MLGDMNVQTPTIRTADDFLRWNEGRAGKLEFVRGRITGMMTGGSRRHAELFLQLAFLLKRDLTDPSLRITAADYAVRTPVGIRYPDVLVHRDEGDGRDLATGEPLFIAEILSPSTLATDFGEKAAEYTALPTLLHYLVLSQDEPRAWLWRRDETQAFGSPEMVAGADESVTLDGFALTLSLAELYRGIA